VFFSGGQRSRRFLGEEKDNFLEIKHTIVRKILATQRELIFLAIIYSEIGFPSLLLFFFTCLFFPPW